MNIAAMQELCVSLFIRCGLCACCPTAARAAREVLPLPAQNWALVLWPEEIAMWEEEENIPCGEVDFVAQYDALMDSEGADGAAERDSDGDSSDDEAV